MDRDAVIRRGLAAKSILSDETAMSALGEIERECFEAWAHTNPTDSETREFQYRQMRAIELFQAKLETFAQQGSHAKLMIEQEERERAVL